MSNERHHPLLELTRARIVEFLREPEAVFWVFVFPVLLALALGIAFRSKPVDRPQVAPWSASTRADAGRAPARLDARGAGARRRRGGRRPCARRGSTWWCVAAGAGLGDLPLRRHPRGGPRGAPGRRRRACSARGAGGTSSRPPTRPHRRSRRAVHRLPHPRPDRPEPDGQRHVGHRLLGRDRAHAQAAQAVRRDADAAVALPGVVRLLAAALPRPRGGGGGRLRPAHLRRQGPRFRWSRWRWSP